MSITTMRGSYPLLRVISPSRGYASGMTSKSSPSADDLMQNESPGDGIMEDDLTEERYPTPAEREDVAEDQPQDP